MRIFTTDLWFSTLTSCADLYYILTCIAFCVITLCVRKVITFCVEKLLHFALNTLLHFASMLLHFAAILITFCVSITFCSDYYILRRVTGIIIFYDGKFIQVLPTWMRYKIKVPACDSQNMHDRLSNLLNQKGQEIKEGTLSHNTLYTLFHSQNTIIKLNTNVALIPPSSAVLVVTGPPNNPQFPLQPSIPLHWIKNVYSVYG